MIVRLGFVIAVLGMGVATSAAQAQDTSRDGFSVAGATGATVLGGPGAAKSVRVSVNDLDLSTASGRSSLSGRVRHAVQTVCPGSRYMSLTESMQSRDCAKVARASAKAPTQLAIARAEQQQVKRNKALAAR